MESLDNQVIVINGGSGRLGRSVAEQIIDYDCFLVLIGRDEVKLKEICVELKGKAKVSYFVCDLTNEKQVKKTINKINSQYKKIDILVNSVGSWFQGEIPDHSTVKVKELFDSNVLGVISFVSQALDLVRKSSKGQILNIVSTFTSEGLISWPIYLSSKAALKSFTESLKLTVKEEQIKIMAIHPDAINRYNIEHVVRIILFMLEQPNTIFISNLETKNNYFPVLRKQA